ncbi:hypothetical protein ACKWTF_003653 [Chironomus riparius]
MEPKSKEVVERFKEKIPLIKHVDYRRYGITQLDIICEDKSIKQYVLLFERLLFIEPTEFITAIYADVYIRIRDEILLQIALKEISLDEALSQKLFKIYGDTEIWDLQLKALREILPNEHFTAPAPRNVDEIQIVEENVEHVIEPQVDDEEEEKKESVPPLPKRPASPQLKFLADAFAKIMQKKP